MKDLEKTRAEEQAPQTLASLCCDLKNSLSVVSGNAQLLAELIRQELSEHAAHRDQFVSSTQDIREAGEQMTESLHRLARFCNALGKPCDSDSNGDSFEGFSEDFSVGHSASDYPAADYSAGD